MVAYRLHLDVEILNLRLTKSRTVWDYDFQFAVDFSEWKQTHAAVILSAGAEVIYPRHRVSTERTLHFKST